MSKKSTVRLRGAFRQVDFIVKRREWEVLAAADFENPSENAASEVGFGGFIARVQQLKS